MWKQYLYKSQDRNETSLLGTYKQQNKTRTKINLLSLHPRDVTLRGILLAASKLHAERLIKFSNIIWLFITIASQLCRWQLVWVVRIYCQPLDRLLCIADSCFQHLLEICDQGKLFIAWDWWPLPWVQWKHGWRTSHLTKISIDITCMSNCYNLYHDWTLPLNACLRRLYMISVSLPVEVRLARPNRIASAMILAILFSDGRWRPILMHLCTNWLSLPYWPPHTNTCAKSLYTVYRDIAGVCANRFCTNWERY